MEVVEEVASLAAEAAGRSAEAEHPSEEVASLAAEGEHPSAEAERLSPEARGREVRRRLAAVVLHRHLMATVIPRVQVFRLR